MDIVQTLRDFGEMSSEGGDADPLIEVMNSLAHQAADEIIRLRADNTTIEARTIERCAGVCDEVDKDPFVACGDHAEAIRNLKPEGRR